MEAESENPSVDDIQTVEGVTSIKPTNKTEVKNKKYYFARNLSRRYDFK